MYRNILESHAHYDEKCYAPNLVQVLEEQRQKGVCCIINSGSDVGSSHRSVELARRFDMVYAAVGVFPLAVENLPADWLEEIRTLSMKEKVVAIGEIGLDYHAGTGLREQQIAVFEAQLELAKERNLPIQIHDRDADADTIALVKKHRPRGMVHRFASSPQVGRAFLELGMHLGIGPNITYPEFAHVLETVRAMPLERLVLETDSPFLPPARLAGQISTSDMIGEVAETIAKVRGDCTPQEVLDLACENARRLFAIS